MDKSTYRRVVAQMEQLKRRNNNDVIFVIKNKMGNYVDKNGSGLISLYKAKLVVEELDDGRFKIVKDRNRKAGDIITEEELFLELI